MQNVDIPITIMADNFDKSLTALINGSHLPPFIIVDKLKAVYLEVKMAAQKQVEYDKQSYQETIKQHTDKISEGESHNDSK